MRIPNKRQPKTIIKVRYPVAIVNALGHLLIFVGWAALYGYLVNYK